MPNRTIPPGELEQQLLDRLAHLNNQKASKRTRRSGSRGRARVRLAGVFGVLALFAIGISGTFAVHDEGFQLDGNASAGDLHHGAVCVDDDGIKQTPCVNVPAGDLTGAFAGALDWDSLLDISGTPAPGNALGAVTVKSSLPAPFTGADFQKDFKNSGTTFQTGDDTTFATGSKDTLDITPGWQCNHDNNVNSKTDIINGFAATAEVGDDQLFYFGLEKDVDNGDNNVGMWLFQDPTVGCSSTGTAVAFTGHHVVGDLLVVSAFTNGGGVSNIDVYEWVGGPNPLSKIASSADCLIKNGGDSVCATVFEPSTGSTTLHMPWLTADNGVVNASHPSPNFYEGGINLSAFPQFADRCFTGYLLDTRSSQSTTATLFDYVTGSIGTCEPAIEVTKEASPTDVCSGGDTDVTYTYTVTNTGNVDLTNIDISDDTIPGAQAAFEAANGNSDDLAEGAGPVTFTLHASIGDTTHNVVTVDADSIAGANTASDTASADVTAHDCTISVTKSADSHDLCVGGSTTYDFSITNNSDEFTWTGTLIDDVVGDIGGGTFSLDPGQTMTFNDVAGPALSDDTTNTVTGDGAFDDPDATAAMDQASDTVNVNDCTVDVTKSADEHDICVGHSTTYDFSITNNSTFTWTGTLIDDVVGDIGGGTFSVDPGQTVNFNDVAGPALSDDTTNTVTADGAFDDPDATAAGDTASDTVSVHDCTITVTKSNPDDVCDGGAVSYDYSITNNSDEFTWAGTLVDDQLGDVGGGTITLAPGETKNFSAGANITGEVTNKVTGDGAFDDPDATSASDDASATVSSHVCTITITKTPSDTQVCNGDTVSYSYTVTNNSDVFDWTGDVVDDAGTPADTSDDVTLADDVTIAAGATENYSLPNVVINGTVTNTVTADGAFNDPNATAASDFAEATVVGGNCGGGCTPGFWQGGNGAKLWNILNDPDWVSAGGAGTNPFASSTVFSTFFEATGSSSVDSKTMGYLVGSGGGSSWPRKAARDLVAAYLNASFGAGVNYPYTTAEILADWHTAVTAGNNSGYQAFHLKYGAANQLGCTL